MKYTLITPKGKKTEMPYTKPTLQQLQEAVGGYVQMVRGPGGCTLWCNEDGIALNLPYNPYVSHLWPSGMLGNVLVGTPKGWKGTLDAPLVRQRGCGHMALATDDDWCEVCAEEPE